MIDLSTTYLGLKLAHPLVVGASPIGEDLDLARRKHLLLPNKV